MTNNHFYSLQDQKNQIAKHSVRSLINNAGRGNENSFDILQDMMKLRETLEFDCRF